MISTKLSKAVAFTCIAATTFLAGCNHNSSSTNTGTNTATKFTPIYSIQPDKVDDYVETFQRNIIKNQLEFNGKTYPLKNGDPQTDENMIVAEFSEGWLLISFDFKKEKPLAGLAILLGDPKQGLEDTSLYQVYKPITVPTIEEQEGDYVYSAALIDPTGNNQYDVKLTYNESLISAGSSQFSYQGDKAVITGDLGTTTYVQMRDLLNNHPGVKTLVLQNISGSVNDEINMFTGRLVRNAGLSTLVPKDGEIASGGVDLFSSGVERKIEAGAKVEVHSWCCGDNGKPANQLSKEDKAHRAQLTYFREMLGAKIGPDFYWFTLAKADFDAEAEEMLMSQQELKKYLLTN